MPERLVVIGGDAAGMSAASLARRRRSERELEVIAFERSGFTSYSACGLPYYVAGEIDDVDQLIARSPEAHRANGIDVRLRQEVVDIDLERRKLSVIDRLHDTEHVEAFDQLVIATGATPIRPDLPGVERARRARHTDDHGRHRTARRRRANTTAQSWWAAATSGSRWPRR